MNRAPESADRLAGLDVERVLCYHGGVVDEGSERMQEIVDARR